MSDEVKFSDFNLSPNLFKAINKLGFEFPTEIQAKTIPVVLEGKDVVGESATGSGKTLAFGCGAIDRCVPKKGVQALILVPTRELAQQVSSSINELIIGNSLKTVCLFGGVALGPQEKDLKVSEIVIATPGRLNDHIRRRTINLSRVSMLVLDEADRMLDMGFVDDIDEVVKHCPKNRQTLFFSATFPPQVRALANRYLSDPVTVKVKNQVDPSLLKQVYYDVRSNMKLSLLIHLIKKEKANKIIIFCNTRTNSDLIHKNLVINNIKASVLHGGFTQSSRTKVIDDFKSGRCQVLVCTDVAARGIHVDDVSHVYNYDIPKDPNDYVHRIGRTARAGEEGLVINILCDFDHQNFSKVGNSFDFNIIKMDFPDEVDKVKFVMPKKSEERDSGSRGRGRDSGSGSRGGDRSSGSGSRGGGRDSGSGSRGRSGGSSFRGRSSDSGSGSRGGDRVSSSGFRDRSSRGSDDNSDSRSVSDDSGSGSRGGDRSSDSGSGFRGRSSDSGSGSRGRSGGSSFRGGDRSSGSGFRGRSSDSGSGSRGGDRVSSSGFRSRSSGSESSDKRSGSGFSGERRSSDSRNKSEGFGERRQSPSSRSGFGKSKQDSGTKSNDSNNVKDGKFSFRSKKKPNSNFRRS